MLDFTGFLLLAGPVALGVTKVTDFIRNAFDSRPDNPDRFPKWVWNVVPAVLGVGFCLATASNFTGSVVGLQPDIVNHLSGTWGQLATGLAIGGLASFWHEALDSLSQSATLKSAEATAAEPPGE